MKFKGFQFTFSMRKFLNILEIYNIAAFNSFGVCIVNMLCYILDVKTESEAIVIEKEECSKKLALFKDS